MIFSAIHTTGYHYDKLVFLEPHTIRLKPRTNGTQQLLNFSIEITPTPSGLTECRDLDGNMEHVVWFNGMTDRLIVTVTCKVVTFRVDPFAFLLTQEAINLPLDSNKVYRPSVKPYLSNTIAADVSSFARQIAAEANMDTLAFLRLLNRYLHSTCKIIIREEGPPYEPSKTLQEHCGACRDLTWLFIACCRSQGIGSRFVSGYQEKTTNSTHLHAWAEVYLPGVGWKGYDPSLGLAVTDRHVTLAAGPRADSAAPVSGTYRGEGGAKIESNIDLTVTAS